MMLLVDAGCQDTGAEVPGDEGESRGRGRAGRGDGDGDGRGGVCLRTAVRGRERA